MCHLNFYLAIYFSPLLHLTALDSANVTLLDLKQEAVFPFTCLVKYQKIL